MHRIEQLHHTADICIRIEGTEASDLFRGGVEAMTRIMREDACHNGRELTVRHPVVVTSVDRTTLLVDFLSDVLTLMQTEKAVFCRTTINQLSETALEAEVLGYPVSSFDEDIKAVTYHQADVRQRPDQWWETLIIFDI